MERLSLERRQQTHALDRDRGAAGATCGVRGAGGVERGRHQIDDVGGFAHDAAAVGDPRRPVDDQRGSDAPFVDPVLVEAERGVAGVGPVGAVALVARLGAWQHLRVVADRHRAAVEGLTWDREAGPPFRQNLGATAVVGQEQDQRVVETAGLLQRRDDLAYAPIHAVDLGGIDLHRALEPGPFLAGNVLPGEHARVALGDRPVGLDQPEFDQPPAPFGADRVPAGGVTAPVAGDVLRQRVQRPVGRGVGHVEEERIVASFALRVVTHEARRVLGDCVRVVVDGGLGVVRRREFHGFVVFGEGDRVVEAAGAMNRAVETVEAALPRPVVSRGEFVVAAPVAHVTSDVPLPRHVGAVAGLAECLGDRHRVGGEVAAVSRQPVVAHHVADAGLVRVEAGQQGRAGRAAACRVVEVAETQAVRGQQVEVGRVDLAAVAAQVGEAHVVRHDEDDVGPGRGVDTAATGKQQGDCRDQHGDDGRPAKPKEIDGGLLAW